MARAHIEVIQRPPCAQSREHLKRVVVDATHQQAMFAVSPSHADAPGFDTSTARSHPLELIDRSSDSHDPARAFRFARERRQHIPTIGSQYRTTKPPKEQSELQKHLTPCQSSGTVIVPLRRRAHATTSDKRFVRRHGAARHVAAPVRRAQIEPASDHRCAETLVAYERQIGRVNDRAAAAPPRPSAP